MEEEQEKKEKIEEIELEEKIKIGSRSEVLTKNVSQKFSFLGSIKKRGKSINFFHSTFLKLFRERFKKKKVQKRGERISLRSYKEYLESKFGDNAVGLGKIFFTKVNKNDKLALSGGGIRAACFSLGVLERLISLENQDNENRGGRDDILKKGFVFDDISYISTVSGSGYAIGSFFTHYRKDYLRNLELAGDNNMNEREKKRIRHLVAENSIQDTIDMMQTNCDYLQTGSFSSFHLLAVVLFTLFYVVFFFFSTCLWLVSFIYFGVKEENELKNKDVLFGSEINFFPNCVFTGVDFYRSAFCQLGFYSVINDIKKINASKTFIKNLSFYQSSMFNQQYFVIVLGVVILLAVFIVPLFFLGFLQFYFRHLNFITDIFTKINKRTSRNFNEDKKSHSLFSSFLWYFKKSFSGTFNIFKKLFYSAVGGFAFLEFVKIEMFLLSYYYLYFSENDILFDLFICGVFVISLLIIGGALSVFGEKIRQVLPLKIFIAFVAFLIPIFFSIIFARFSIWMVFDMNLKFFVFSEDTVSTRLIDFVTFLSFMFISVHILITAFFHKPIQYAYRFQLIYSFFKNGKDLQINKLKEVKPYYFIQGTLNNFRYLERRKEDKRDYFPYVFSPTHIGSEQTGFSDVNKERVDFEVKVSEDDNKCWFLTKIVFNLWVKILLFFVNFFLKIFSTDTSNFLSLSKSISISGAALGITMGGFDSINSFFFKLFLYLFMVDLGNWVYMPYLISTLDQKKKWVEGKVKNIKKISKLHNFVKFGFPILDALKESFWIVFSVSLFFLGGVILIIISFLDIADVEVMIFYHVWVWVFVGFICVLFLIGFYAFCCPCCNLFIPIKLDFLRSLSLLFNHEQHEFSSSYYITDGGHIDMLGLYSLIRYGKCKKIYCFDAGEDKELIMGDLYRILNILIEEEEIEDRIIIENISYSFSEIMKSISKDHLLQRSKKNCIVIKLFYKKVNQGFVKIFYGKATLTGDEFRDDPLLELYASNNPNFPHITTLYQFFDQEQFVAYKRLGNYVTKKVLELEKKVDELERGQNVENKVVLEEEIIEIDDKEESKTDKTEIVEEEKNEEEETEKIEEETEKIEEKKEKIEEEIVIDKI